MILRTSTHQNQLGLLVRLQMNNLLLQLDLYHFLKELSGFENQIPVSMNPLTANILEKNDMTFEHGNLAFWLRLN